MKSNFSGCKIQGFCYCFFLSASDISLQSPLVWVISVNNCIFSKVLCHYYFNIFLLMFPLSESRLHVLYHLKLFSNSWCSFVSVCLGFSFFFLFFVSAKMVFCVLFIFKFNFFFFHLCSISWELIKVILSFSLELLISKFLWSFS